jgi:hypothetical protein
MEKVGLRFVRVFHQPWSDRIEGEEYGDVEYALTRDEWGTEPDVETYRGIHGQRLTAPQEALASDDGVTPG